MNMPSSRTLVVDGMQPVLHNGATWLISSVGIKKNL